MQSLLPTTDSLDAEGRPGLTSLVRTGRGLMTVQTELVGDPAELLTIVDFRGRVLKTWRSPFTLDEHAASTPERIRSWHRNIERRLRDKLAAVSRRRSQTDVEGDVVAHLFVAAIRAYGARDLDTACALLEACDQLRPDDRRVRAALARARDLVGRAKPRR